MGPNQPSAPGNVDWEKVNELLALDEQGKTEEALAGLQEMVGSASDSEEKANILLLTASLHAGMGHCETAQKIASDVLSIIDTSSGTYVRALYVNASMDVAQGRWADALEKLEILSRQYRHVLESPENEYLLHDFARNKGIALYRLGKPADARGWLEKAIGTDYDKATALYYLGRSCYELGDLEQSKQSLQGAISLDLDPRYRPSAKYVLGLALHWQGQDARAVEEFEWCLTHDQKERVPKRQVLTALVEAYKALGMSDKMGQYSEMLRKL